MRCRASVPLAVCRATHSSSVDQYPNTQTLSFYGSTYTSPYIDFTPVEEQTNQIDGNTYAPLQSPTAAQSALLATYDKAPYTTEAGSIPFIDIANRSIIVGASYSPAILAGLSAQQIAADLGDPSNPVAQAIDRRGQPDHRQHLYRHQRSAGQRLQLVRDRGHQVQGGLRWRLRRDAVPRADLCHVAAWRLGRCGPRSHCRWLPSPLRRI